MPQAGGTSSLAWGDSVQVIKDFLGAAVGLNLRSLTWVGKSCPGTGCTSPTCKHYLICLRVQQLVPCTANGKRLSVSAFLLQSQPPLSRVPRVQLSLGFQSPLKLRLWSPETWQAHPDAELFPLNQGGLLGFEIIRNSFS